MERILRPLVTAVAMLALAVPLATAQTTLVPPPAPGGPRASGPTAVPSPRTPTPTQEKVVEGSVKKVDPLAQTVQVGWFLGLLSTTVEVTGDTAIASADGKKTSFVDIREGDMVKASYEDREGKHIAKSIEVTPAEANNPAATDQSPTYDIKTKGNSTADAASDSWMTLKAKMALLADDKVSSTNVHVTTRQGVITLRGRVESDEAKQAAEADAQKVDGVQKVVNHLVVVPKSAQKMVQWRDDQIVEDIENRLKTDSHLKQASIDVHSDNGIVTLSGDVPSPQSSLRASEMARRVSGVRAVHNELTIQNGNRQG
jgi:osmotically-inducible protein OsmY